MFGGIIRTLFRLSVLLAYIKALRYTSLVNEYTPQPNPYKKYGGDFRKGSYCLVVLSTINFILLIIDEFWRSNSGSRLRKLSGKLFVNVTRPCSLTFCTTVWFCLLVNFNISWVNGSRWFPRWYGHTMYTLPAFFALVESFFAPHDTDGFGKAMKRSFGSLGFFILWQLSILIFEGSAQTPLLMSPWWQLMLLALGISTINFIMLGIGYIIDYAVHGLPLEVEEVGSLKED